MLILPSNTTSQNLYTHDHLITKFYKHGNRKGPMPNILICELMSFKELGQKKKENICLESDCPFLNSACIAY